MSGYLNSVSWNVCLMTDLALLSEIGRCLSCSCVAAFAVWSAASFPGMFEWPGIH